MMKNHMYIPAATFKIPRIIEVAKRTCTLKHYRDRQLWYSVEWQSTPDVFPAHLDPDRWEVVETRLFEFPVSVDDPAATGYFEPEMKAITLMRWINARIALLKESQNAQ